MTRRCPTSKTMFQTPSGLQVRLDELGRANVHISFNGLGAFARECVSLLLMIYADPLHKGTSVRAQATKRVAEAQTSTSVPLPRQYFYFANTKSKRVEPLPPYPAPIPCPYTDPYHFNHRAPLYSSSPHLHSSFDISKWRPRNRVTAPRRLSRPRPARAITTWTTPSPPPPPLRTRNAMGSASRSVAIPNLAHQRPIPGLHQGE